MTPGPRKNKALPSNARAKMISRIVLALVLLSLGILLAESFLASLGWAVIIAVTTWPLYLRFMKVAGFARDSVVPAFIFAIVAGALVLFPIALAAHQAGQESAAIERSLSQYRKNGIPVPRWLPSIPGVGAQAAQWWQANLANPDTVGEWIGKGDDKDVISMTPSLGAEILHRVFLILVSLVALFNLLRHGEWVSRRFLDTADRLLGEPGEGLATKMVDAIRGTVTGTVAVAVVEGALIGFAYFLAGVSNPILYTLLTMAFAMIPFGAWAVFGWASLLLIQAGDVWTGASLFAFGALIMVIGDMLFWPALVGEAARLPFLVAFIGIFGGLKVFGLLGLFLGPVIMAALYVIWREWLPKEKSSTDG